ncbi:MAG: hypothetical protein IPF92_25365 [Myxococcales bacterium]|jgi:hypothetical protein|nr:hypothetical protein [Myxococcales bacterium]MBL0195749.1 hypothetical protein [Myxococcales bacterium]HQY60056.1 hypothetical protein [Polyangiaceae bacterium]
MPGVARLVVALTFALSALGFAVSGCGSNVDLGGFRSADAGPDAPDASTD